MLAASNTVGAALKKGDIVVYESTVYPGAVEEECLPVLEKKSGLAGGRDFTVGYSPERINPGDKKHRFETITKVVSAQDAAHARHCRRRLWLGGHGRHPPRALDQGGRSGQGDREHAARPQHRLHERAVGNLPAARHRHRRCAGRRRHQMELPEVRARPGRRPLHRGRSVLSDLPRRKGRLPPRDHPCGTAHQRQHGRTRGARMHARVTSTRTKQSHGRPSWE